MGPITAWKMHDIQWSIITERKSAITIMIKIWNKKSESGTMTFLSWTQSFWFQIWISGTIFKSAIHLKIKMSDNLFVIQ